MHDPLRIRLYGDPVLQRRSQPVKTVGPKERGLIRSMIEAMHRHKGVGLAAPQVGVNQQILVADIGHGPLAVINPQIIEKDGWETMEEGCLSLPGISVEVKRSQRILLRYLDENNEVLEQEYSDLLARVILHEIDHLKGKLIIDYLPLTKRLKVRAKLQTIRRARDNDHPQTKF